MLILAAIVTVLAIVLGIYLTTRSKSKRTIYFVGPHSSGKTTSILKLLGLPQSTVTTLGDHKACIGKTEIVELVQNDLTQDFISRFRINCYDQFIFFVKNDEEVEYFPDLSGFDVKLVKWQKGERKEPKNNLIYLDEDPEKLRKLLKIE